jgi:hypothetical protein
MQSSRHAHLILCAIAGATISWGQAFGSQLRMRRRIDGRLELGRPGPLAAAFLGFGFLFLWILLAGPSSGPSDATTFSSGGKEARPGHTS